MAATAAAPPAAGTASDMGFVSPAARSSSGDCTGISQEYASLPCDAARGLRPGCQEDRSLAQPPFSDSWRLLAGRGGAGCRYPSLGNAPCCGTRGGSALMAALRSLSRAVSRLSRLDPLPSPLF